MEDEPLGSESRVRLARHSLEIAHFDEFGKSTFASCEDEKKRKTCVGRLFHALQWYVSRETIGKCPSKKGFWGSVHGPLILLDCDLKVVKANKP